MSKLVPVELTDAELDAVAGGQSQVIDDARAAAGAGLVNVAVGAVQVSALNNNNVELVDLVDVNNNQVGIGVAVAALGAGAAAGNLFRGRA